MAQTYSVTQIRMAAAGRDCGGTREGQDTLVETVGTDLHYRMLSCFMSRLPVVSNARLDRGKGWCKLDSRTIVSLRAGTFRNEWQAGAWAGHSGARCKRGASRGEGARYKRGARLQLWWQRAVARFLHESWSNPTDHKTSMSMVIGQRMIGQKSLWMESCLVQVL